MTAGKSSGDRFSCIFPLYLPLLSKYSRPLGLVTTFQYLQPTFSIWRGVRCLVSILLLLSVTQNKTLTDSLHRCPTHSAIICSIIMIELKWKHSECDKSKVFLLWVQLAQKNSTAGRGRLCALFQWLHSKWEERMALHKNKTNWKPQCLLIVYNHGSITVGRLLFDDADQFKGFANRTIRIWPFWTLKMPHFEYIVILQEWKKHKSVGER